MSMVSSEGLTEYERKRAERIRQNNEQLAAVRAAAAKVRAVCDAVSAPAEWRRRKRPHRPEAAAAPAAAPSRASKRLRGETVVDTAEDGGDGPSTPALGDPDALSPGALLSLDEYLERNGLPKGPLMDGHYRGWVEEGCRARLGIAGSADAAWEEGGGGVFQRRPPKGESAKDFARSMLHKNPNSYFYRHNEPGEAQHNGDWTEEEVQLFVRVALEHGCGDKWGLFASHIPHRVGYQCSAAYRHVVIPRGLLRDNRFRMTASGEAVYCAGRH